MGSHQGRGSAAELVVILAVVSLFVRSVMGANHVVGGSQQWTLGVDYSTWAAGETFSVGDTLEFIYTSAHDVVQVTQSDYNSCSQGSNTVSTNGDTKFTLSTAGTTYYICAVPTHCSNGMKLAVTTGAANSTTPAPTTPSTSPPNANGTTPSTTPSTTSSPSSPNSAPYSSFPEHFLSLTLVIAGLSILLSYSV